ncbi:hypothetical protein BDN71DRAFT_1510730 [Pleurotus eryngii]|uniref:Uncharacterized protein n=1 Tax=Pleurotus eryngii TaxID=5323 RepID=A0A9P5ZPW6_PLEER|nr:hypothetical protein BDN71DRAFT_1510730 [Pleurotus eryngii]
MSLHTNDLTISAVREEFLHNSPCTNTFLLLQREDYRAGIPDVAQEPVKQWLQGLPSPRPQIPSRFYSFDTNYTSIAPSILPSITTPHPVQVHFATSATSSSVYIPGFGQVEDSQGVSSAAVRSRRAASIASTWRSETGGPLSCPYKATHSLPSSPRSESPTGLHPLILTQQAQSIDRLPANTSYLQGKDWTIPSLPVNTSQRGNYPSSSHPQNRRSDEDNRSRLSARAKGKLPSHPPDDSNEQNPYTGPRGNGGGPGGNGSGPGRNSGGSGGNGGGPGGNGGGGPGRNGGGSGGNGGGPGGNGPPPRGPYNPPHPYGRCGPNPPPDPGDHGGGGAPPDPPPPGGLIPIPAPRAPLEFCWQFSSKIPLSSLPEWDGKPTTVIQYVSELSYYQQLGDDITNHLARVTPFRFTGLAKTWFNGLSLNDRLRCTANMTNFLIFIREQFMHDKWRYEHGLEFDRMYFRRGKEFRNELPIEWPNLNPSSAVAFSRDGPALGELTFLRNIPKLSGNYLNVSTPNNLTSLFHASDNYNNTLINLPVSTNEFLASDKDIAEAFAADRKCKQPTRSLSTFKKKRFNWPNSQTFKGHAFTRNDSQQSQAKPPGDCRLCTSPLHFYRECPHFPMWDAITKRLRTQGQKDPKDLHKVDREYKAHVVSTLTEESDSNSSEYSAPKLNEYCQLVRNSFNATKYFHATSPISLNRAHCRRFERKDESKGKEPMSNPSKSSPVALDPPSPLTSLIQAQVAKGSPSVGLENTATHIIQLPTGSDESLKQSQTNKMGNDEHTAIIIAPKARMKAPGLNAQGSKVRLQQLTCSAVILGFVNTHLYVRSEANQLIQFDVEAYVVQDMQVPLLLGEDFMTSYEMGITHKASRQCTVYAAGGSIPIPASTSDNYRLGIYIRKAYLGSKALQRKQARKARRRSPLAYLPDSPTAVIASNSITITPGHCCNLSVILPDNSIESWFIESAILTEDGQDILAAPATILSPAMPFLPIANPSSRPLRIRKGDIVGYAFDPTTHFETPSSVERWKSLRSHALMVSKLIDVCQEIPHLVFSPDTPPSSPTPSFTSERWGPKTTATPEDDSPEDIVHAVQLGSDILPEICPSLEGILRRRSRAFGLKG